MHTSRIDTRIAGNTGQKGNLGASPQLECWRDGIVE